MTIASLSTIATPSVTGAQTVGLDSSGLAKVKGAKPLTMEKIDAVSKDFEAQFISEMMSSMFSTIDPKNSFGGSEAEDTYRSLMVNEYGKIISRAGGIGIAAQIKRDMLKLQEVKPS